MCALSAVGSDVVLHLRLFNSFKIKYAYSVKLVLYSKKKSFGHKLQCRDTDIWSQSEKSGENEKLHNHTLFY